MKGSNFTSGPQTQRRADQLLHVHLRKRLGHRVQLGLLAVALGGLRALAQPLAHLDGVL